MDNSKWELFAKITTAMQEKVFEAKSRSELLHNLIEFDLPFDKNEFSVIYKAYGDATPRFLIVEGKKIDKKFESESVIPFERDLECFNNHTTRDGAELLYFKTVAECAESGFSNYASVLLSPMHSNKNKNDGFFVLHCKDKEYAYDDLTVEIIKLLGDYCAFYMKTNLMNRRHLRLDELHKEIVRREFSSENDLFEIVLKELKKWFSSDDIYLLLINPFDTEKYLLVCDKGNLIHDFRNKSLPSQDKLSYILGDTNRVVPVLNKEGVLKLDSCQEIENHMITSPCKSWLGVRLQASHDYIIGYVVLQNMLSENSHEQSEGKFISKVADIFALTFIEKRNALRNNIIKHFLKYESNYNGELYKDISHCLSSIYGNIALAIVIVSHPSMKLELEFCQIENFGLDSNSNFYSALEMCIHHKKINNGNDTLTHPDSGDLLILPIQDDGKGIGCLLVSTPRCSHIVISYLDMIASVLKEILLKSAENERSGILAEFGYKVSILGSEGASLKNVMELASDYISKAMFSHNLFIAFYDKSKNKLSFPIFKKNGEIWQQEERLVNFKKRGKTEEIIYTRKSLLHSTRKESEEWYKQPEHQEFAGDPLASWIGVPIFAPNKEVRGVIATYHPTLDNVYSEQDLKFLEKLSHLVSGLFRDLDNYQLHEANRKLEEALNNNTQLKEMNHKLKEAQKEIADKEALIASTLVAQDITHRLNNALGSLHNQIDFAIEDMKRVIAEKENASILKETVGSLTISKETVGNLIGEVKKVTKPEAQEIPIRELFNKLSNQIFIKQGLYGNVFIYHELPDDNDIKVNVFYRNLYTCMHELIENAATALKKQLAEPIQNETLFLKLRIIEKAELAIIDIIDNGVALTQEVEVQMFDRTFSTKADNNSGYGLWRVKTLAETLKGKVEFLRNPSNPSHKIFRLSLPIFKEQRKPIAWVVEDERSWRDIISRWLREIDFEVKMAGDLESAKQLFETEKDKPQLFLLDVALDPFDGGNVDGLILIDKAKQLSSNPKIVILTGYIGNITSEYRDKVDKVIEKIGEETALNRTSFHENLKELGFLLK